MKDPTADFKTEIGNVKNALSKNVVGNDDAKVFSAESSKDEKGIEVVTSKIDTTDIANPNLTASSSPIVKTPTATDIVNEAEIDQYYSSEDVFKNLKDLGVHNKPKSELLNEQKYLLNESLSEFAEGIVKSQEEVIAEYINWKNK